MADLRWALGSVSWHRRAEGSSAGRRSRTMLVWRRLHCHALEVITASLGAVW